MGLNNRYCARFRNLCEWPPPLAGIMNLKELGPQNTQTIFSIFQLFFFEHQMVNLESRKGNDCYDRVDLPYNRLVLLFHQSESFPGDLDSRRHNDHHQRHRSRRRKRSQLGLVYCLLALEKGQIEPFVHHNKDLDTGEWSKISDPPVDSSKDGHWTHRDLLFCWHSCGQSIFPRQTRKNSDWCRRCFSNWCHTLTSAAATAFADSFLQLDDDPK